MHLRTSKSFSVDMFLMVNFPMHRTALLATSGGLDRAHLTACSSRELYRGTYQGRKRNRQADRLSRPSFKGDASSNLEALNVHCENLLYFQILRNYNHGSNDDAS